MSGERRPYAPMPIHILSDTRLDATDLRVLIGVAYFVNQAGVCWPSLASVVEVTGVHRKAVQASLKRLIAWGHIVPLEVDTEVQERGAMGHYSRRYLVKLRPDQPLPSREEIDEARIFQHPRDQMQPFEEAESVRGQPQPHTPPPAFAATRLVVWWQGEVDRRWGLRPEPSDVIRRDAVALLAGAQEAEAKRIIVADLDRRIAAGQGLPLRLPRVTS